MGKHPGPASLSSVRAVAVQLHKGGTADVVDDEEADVTETRCLPLDASFAAINVLYALPCPTHFAIHLVISDQFSSFSSTSAGFVSAKRFSRNKMCS